ncbi:MAG: hypothetical protein DRI48_10390 [Chloroflexi bacterium]|nr:MAG: hypothetical protein DRI48_10390 [Chloroflexota bacterium]
MTKKSTAEEQPQQTAKAGDGGIAVTGGIHAGRDVIMGDQYNDFRQQVARIETPAEFVAQLQALQRELAALKEQAGLPPQQAKEIEVVEENVQQALEEAQKPEPLGARITSTLSGAKGVMESLSGSVKAAVGLGAVLAQLIQVAFKLFG